METFGILSWPCKGLQHLLSWPHLNTLVWKYFRTNIYTFLFGCSCFLKQTNNKKLQANTLWLFPINSRADCQRVCDHGRFSQDLSCTSRLWLSVMEILEELVLFIVAHYFHFLSQHLHIFEKNWTLHLGENSSSVFILFKSVCLLYWIKRV